MFKALSNDQKNAVRQQRTAWNYFLPILFLPIFLNIFFVIME